MLNPNLFSDDQNSANGGRIYYTGITLRDLFAGMAMQGNWASLQEGEDMDFEVCANAAYAQADAMLKARQKGES